MAIGSRRWCRACPRCSDDDYDSLSDSLVGLINDYMAVHYYGWAPVRTRLEGIAKELAVTSKTAYPCVT